MSTFFKIAALALVYAVLGRLGVMMASANLYAAPVWPGTGIALAALLLWGERLWPGVLFGALAVSVWVGVPLPAAFGIAIGNTLEAVVAAVVLRRFANFRGQIDGIAQVSGLIVGGALLSTAVSASIGVLSLYLAHALPVDRIATTWQAWWVGDAVSDLVIAPLLLAWCSSRHRTLGKPQLLEAIALVAALTLAAAYLFLQSVSQTNAVTLPHVLFPLFVWAGLRFGLIGGVTATAIASAVAIAGTARGSGPFMQGTPVENLLSLQVFLGTAAVTTLVVAVANAERVRAIGARQELLEIVSHDLRNPLGAIQLSTGALAIAPPDLRAARIDAHCHLVERCVGRMMRLIGDLVDSAAIDTQSFSVYSHQEPVRAVLEEAVTSQLHLATSKNRRLSVAPGEAFDVMCDRARIIQVLSNLIGNAIKFSKEGGLITVSAERVRNEARVLVEDTGIGIEPGQLRHIFGRYWHATATEGGGTGLGLFIAKGIVEAHGGRMWVESTIDKGSRFYFVIPLRAANRDA